MDPPDTPCTARSYRESLGTCGCEQLPPGRLVPLPQRRASGLWMLHSSLSIPWATPGHSLDTPEAFLGSSLRAWGAGEAGQGLQLCQAWVPLPSAPHPVQPCAAPCIPGQLHAALGSSMHPCGVPCSAMQPCAAPCSLVHPCAAPCIPVQPHLAPCIPVQPYEAPCSLVQPHSAPCSPIQPRAAPYSPMHPVQLHTAPCSSIQPHAPWQRVRQHEEQAEAHRRVEGRCNGGRRGGQMLYRGISCPTSQYTGGVMPTASLIQAGSLWVQFKPRDATCPMG